MNRKILILFSFSNGSVLLNISLSLSLSLSLCSDSAVSTLYTTLTPTDNHSYRRMAEKGDIVQDEHASLTQVTTVNKYM